MGIEGDGGGKDRHVGLTRMSSRHAHLGTIDVEEKGEEDLYRGSGPGSDVIIIRGEESGCCPAGQRIGGRHPRGTGRRKRERGVEERRVVGS